jgi:hypothetical protein
MKKFKIISITALLMIFAGGYAQKGSILNPDLYETASWEHVDSLGNHRAVLKVEKSADAVVAEIPWRMRSIGPEMKNVVVVDASTGKRINNVYPFEINNDRGLFAFQPVTVPGEYYVYYLTYKKEGSYYPKVTYYPFVNSFSQEWVRSARLTTKGRETKLPKAVLVKLQSVNELNSFYPMEIMATSEEVKKLLADNQMREYIVFTEDRKYPVRSNYHIPYKWILNDNISMFRGIADKGEYFTFQAAVYASKKELNNVRVKFENLSGGDNGAKIPAGSFTCFNTEGIDVTGNYFMKEVSVPAGELRPLWFGVMIPEGLPSGPYTGRMIISADGTGDVIVPLNIDVTGRVVTSMGDEEIWRHSRLRWLNSTLAEDDEIVSPFIPLRLNHGTRTIEALGRTVKLGANGLPEQITSWFSERMTGLSDKGTSILNGPVTFRVDSGDKSSWEILNLEFVKVTPGTVGWKSLSKSGSFVLECVAEMDFDGNIDYEMTLMATANALVSDIALEVALAEGVGKYNMGLGEIGGYLKKDIAWKWDVTKNQDGPWVGKENAGIQVRFRDKNYERPLNTNFYQQKPLFMPTSWYNEGKGGINIKRSSSFVTITSYSGERDIKKGDIFHFNFNLAITPFKTLNTENQWSHRFYHRHLNLDTIASYGANTVNIHHATDINPYINYPFLTPGIMKEYVDEAHRKDMKVKFYYTLRELTNSTPELYALRSLGNEIFSEGKGGGYSWLQEHLDQTYIAAWFSPNKTDASIINSGVSRWHNYYVEGLNWLVGNIGIDGIYIDDLAFDRVTMKRMRKVLERGNPGTFLDLHSANQYNPRDGFANSANLYLEHMPFIDRLWFGEYFDYNKKPDFWMVEVSGIPYGVMGEMLQDGGNPWRGMLYGMTGRMPWDGAKIIKPIWDVWDDFGIEKSEMIGYWASDCPVKTGSEETLATAYVIKGQRTLVSLATWADKGESVKLAIDWDAIGISQSEAILRTKQIDDFQSVNSWNPGEAIDVPAGKGFLIIIEKR